MRSKREWRFSAFLRLMSFILALAFLAPPAHGVNPASNTDVFSASTASGPGDVDRDGLCDCGLDCAAHCWSAPAGLSRAAVHVPVRVATRAEYSTTEASLSSVPSAPLQRPPRA
ncbi:hypothetical protein [Beijerinckia sp. L45]|uniref:hypothetical protein n=1 Tax=Beijerinckia sp. L45 TaxID=1641855 RepID=UPI00131CE0AC|nr:hypothetical protein [Beijerinckia sp. L45]